MTDRELYAQHREAHPLKVCRDAYAAKLAPLNEKARIAEAIALDDAIKNAKRQLKRAA